MTRLQQSQFSCSGDLNEILVWGINPMKQLLKLMDTYIEDSLDDEDEDVMVFFRYELEDKINGIEEAIYRFIGAMRKKQGKPALRDSDQEKIGAFLKIMEDKLGADSELFKKVAKALDAKGTETKQEKPELKEVA